MAGAGNGSVPPAHAPVAPKDTAVRIVSTDPSSSASTSPPEAAPPYGVAKGQRPHTSSPQQKRGHNQAFGCGPLGPEARKPDQQARPCILALPNQPSRERICWMTLLPRMFIRCSRESLRIARYLQAELCDDVEAYVWDQGVFGLGGGTLEALAQEARRFQFGALVLAPDDVVIRRTKAGNAPRDNVIFGAGFFMGYLGGKNTFLVWCEDDSLELPSDLGGVTRVGYRRREPPNQAMIGPAATRIRDAVASSLGGVPVAVPRAAFEEPRNGSSVEHRVHIRGRAGLAADTELWAAVAGEWAPIRYHPQGNSLSVAGDIFSGHVYVGNEDSTGSFRILLVVVDNADGEYLRRHQAAARTEGRFTGLPRLPPSAKVLDQIMVTRT
jgi:predicted nucleotide-binding protein